MSPTAQPPAVAASPALTIIVTNYNYGHFLAGCIDSVLAQTTPPHELIVVDDGSTDGSPEVLAAYAERVRVVVKPNGGQASAFNAGFAQATGALVLFLDADDLLRPEAVETVLTHWSEGLTSLSFRLELIDADGRSRGIYEESLRTDDGDKRQRLVTRGVFAFTPTSGNVFSRDFLAGFLPLDEARWRISADLPMIYAAALHGRCAVVPHVLGAYRTHGGNNYYRERLPNVWRLQRGMRDVADALRLLADRERAAADRGGAGAPLEAALRLASLRMRSKLHTMAGDPGDLVRQARRDLAKALTSALPLRQRVEAAIPFAAIGLLGRWAPLRRWIEDPRTRPAILVAAQRRIATARRGEPPRPEVLQRPRWPTLVPFGVTQAPDFNGPMASVLAEGWSGEMSDTYHWSRGPEAVLEFRLDATPHAARVEMGLIIGGAEADTCVSFATALNGRRLTIDHICGHGTIRIDLSREMVSEAATVRLQLSCAPLGKPKSPWGRGLDPLPHFAIRWWRIDPVDLFPSFPLLVPESRRAFATVLPADPEAMGWQVDPDGTAWMRRPEATCRVTVEPSTDPVALTLLLSEAPARGWLRIECGAEEIFSGQVAPGSDLQCPLPPVPNADETGLDLTFAFAASDPTDDGRPGFRLIGLATLRALPIIPASGEGEEAARHPRLNVGERIALDLKAGRERVIGSGWDADDLDGLCNLDLEASFAFGVPATAADPVLRLEIEPQLPEAEGHSHVIAASSGSELLVSARLQGPGVLDVPLPPAAIRPNGDVMVTLHSVLVAERDEAAAVAPPLFAGIRVRALSLLARTVARSATPAALPPYVGTASSVAALLAKAAMLLATTPGSERPLDPLRALRGQLASLVWRLDGRALETHLAEPGRLALFETLGAALRGQDLGPTETALVAAISASGSTRDARLRTFVCGMLLMPSSDLPFRPDLADLPDPLLWDPAATARYLGRIEAGAGPRAGGHEGGEYLRQLLTSIDAVLGREPPWSARYRLAVATLQTLRPGSVAGDIARLWGRCVERHLSRSGSVPARRPPARPAARRLRTGLLVRDTCPDPATGPAFGAAGGLDCSVFDCVTISRASPAQPLEAASGVDGVIDLHGGPVEESVARIRDLGLDVLVLATSLTGFDAMAAVAAHRLAPVQVYLAQFGPLPSGLRSFTDALSAPEAAGEALGAALLDIMARHGFTRPAG